MLDKRFVDRLIDSVDNFGQVIYDEPRERREEGAERTNEKGGQGTHLPYGLCKKYGINLPKNATPKQAWSALKKMGVTPEETFESLKETGSVESGVKSNEEEKENNEIKKSVTSELKEQGVDEDLLNSIDFEDVINYSGLDDLVSSEGFDELPNNTKVLAVKEQQEQYVDSLRYSKQRKDKARWFKGDYADQDSYEEYKPKTWSLWQKLSDFSKTALYKYTDYGYDDINGALRGYKDMDSTTHDFIEDIDAAMQQPEAVFDKDTWLTRGISVETAAKFFGLESLGYDSLYDIPDLDELIGTIPIEKGFMSCGAAKGTGFNEKVMLNVFCPKGTRGIYLAPISHFGGKMGDPPDKWKGEDTQVGGENEMLLQRGLKFEVTRAYKEYGIYYFDIEVIPGKE